MLLNIAKSIKTPSMGESITEGTLTQWYKKVGDFVNRDEQIATIETDKIDVQVNSPEAGVVLELCCNEGDTVSVGGELFKIEPGTASDKAPTPTVESTPVKPAEPVKIVEQPKETKPVEKQEAPKPLPIQSEPKVEKVQPPKATAPSLKSSGDIPGLQITDRTERRVKMNRMRMRIAERLKESQNVAASLTTFNEIDMSALMALRKKYKDAVLEEHKVKLGFMGAFVKASTHALAAIPAVNARIEGDTLVYSDYVDISVAVATPKGLVTPVLRNCETCSIVQIEAALSALSKKAKDNAITLEDMAGGTFTISNGGVFGSLYGTPIINTPQSAILGMHAIKERPVVVDGKIEIRPMMYVALTYDHRIIDGREAVTFLVKVKEAIEDPARLLLNV